MFWQLFSCTVMYSFHGFMRSELQFKKPKHQSCSENLLPFGLNDQYESKSTFDPGLTKTVAMHDVGFPEVLHDPC